MPVRLLVRAQNSPTYPAPSSWRKGDIVAAAPAGHVWGNLERPPNFVRCDLTFQNTPDPEWINESLTAEGGRRTVGLAETEVGPPYPVHQPPLRPHFGGAQVATARRG